VKIEGDRRRRWQWWGRRRRRRKGLSSFVIVTNDPPNEEEVVVFTRENRGRSAQHATCAAPIRSREEEAERLSLFVMVIDEDPPNAHQAQHRPFQATAAMSA
jgi:hypothetical protein